MAKDFLNRNVSYTDHGESHFKIPSMIEREFRKYNICLTKETSNDQ